MTCSVQIQNQPTQMSDKPEVSTHPFVFSNAQPFERFDTAGCSSIGVAQLIRGNSERKTCRCVSPACIDTHAIPDLAAQWLWISRREVDGLFPMIAKHAVEHCT
jgi:hypothetical protein